MLTSRLRGLSPIHCHAQNGAQPGKTWWSSRKVWKAALIMFGVLILAYVAFCVTYMMIVARFVAGLFRDSSSNSKQGGPVPWLISAAVSGHG